MSSEEATGKAPAGDDDVNRKLQIGIKAARERLGNDKEAFQNLPICDLWTEMLINRAVAQVTYKELSELRVTLRKSLAVSLQGNEIFAMLQVQNNALGAELEVERCRTDALAADINTIKSELEASKTATEQERRIDALAEENKTLKCELDTLKTTIHEKIKAAIEQSNPGDLKQQVEESTKRITKLDEVLGELCSGVDYLESEVANLDDRDRELGEGISDLWMRVEDLEDRMASSDEGSSDEGDSDDEDDGEDSNKGDLGSGDREDSHDGTKNSDDSNHSDDSEDGGDSEDSEDSDVSDGGHESEDGGGKGTQDESGSENESERWSLAGQVGPWENIDACGASDGVGEVHNGTKRHEYNDCCGHGKRDKPNTGDLPPFSSEQQVLEKVRKIRQSRSKQSNTTCAEVSPATVRPSTSISSAELPIPTSQRTTLLPSSGALNPPTSGTSITAQLHEERHVDELASELKKKVEAPKVAATKEIAAAARKVDEKADRLDKMMLEFETRMAQAYSATRAEDITQESPNLVGNVAPSTSSSHKGIREIRYDHPPSDNAANPTSAAATGWSAHIPSAPKSLPGFFSNHKPNMSLHGFFSASKASSGSIPVISETARESADTTKSNPNKWPSEWPMYWEGGDPTGLGRKRNNLGEANETGEAELGSQSAAEKLR